MMPRAFYLLAGIILIAGSCKKDTAAKPTIYGKWFTGAVNSKLYNNKGKLIDTVSNSKFTSSDFVYYSTDGTGYFSNASKISSGASLSLFNFTIIGITLTQTGTGQVSDVTETVTALTATTLQIHAEYDVPDPNDYEQTDKEIDDISYHR